MPTTEKSKESGKTAKPGQTTVNGEQGSHAHAEDGAQADETLTAEAVASLLKSDLAPAVEDLAADAQQTAADEEDLQQTTAERESRKAKGERPKPEEGEEEPQKNAENAEKAKNPEAQKEVNAWKEVIAELESELEDAEEEKKAEIQKQIEEGKKELEAWEQLAAGATAPEGSEPSAVPEALASAIEEWETNGGGELPAALQTLVDKKINKLTSRAKQAETRVEELEGEVQSLKSKVRSPTDVGPMLDSRQLDLIERSGRQAIEEVQAVREGVATEEEVKRVANLIGIPSERLDTPEARRALMKKANELEEGLRAVPAERQRIAVFRTEEAKVAPIAKEVFPFLYNKADPDYQVAQNMLRTDPDLVHKTPNHQIALGFLVLGRQVAIQRWPHYFGDKAGQAGAAGPRRAPTKPPRKAPSKSPASAGGAAAPQGARTRARDAEETAARAQHEKRPTAASVTRLLKASLPRA